MRKAFENFMEKFKLNHIALSLSIVVLGFGTPTICFGAPVIANYSGTVTHGQTITINGSGFGTKSPVAPVLWDAVDNIAAYAGLSDGATIPTGSGYPWTSAAYGNSSGNGYVKMNTVLSEQRGKSAKQYKAVNQTTAYLDGLTWQATDYVYVSWWYKQTATYTGQGLYSAKWLRLSNANDEVNKTFSFTDLGNYVYRTDTGYCQLNNGVNWDGWNGNPNNWNFIEVWINSANRTYTIRINGQALSSNISWANCAAFQFNELWKIGMDCGGTSPLATTWWMDDIYVDNSFARVMIGNASTYSASTHFEMQIPHTTWTDTQIQVQVNQGSFDDGSTAYLYVIDANGNVSNGKAITFGSVVKPNPPTLF